MSDPAHLRPLVASALGQVASLQIQIEYWDDIARPWRAAGEQLPEELGQRLEKLHVELDHRKGMLRRLKEKLDEATSDRVLP
jgi:hypothetical protein